MLKIIFGSTPVTHPLNGCVEKGGLRKKFLTRVTDEQEKVSFAYILIYRKAHSILVTASL